MIATQTARTRPLGFLLHLHHEHLRSLAHCGVFGTGAGERITDQVRLVTCADCLSEGPASAWITLPDGSHIARRSFALTDYEYAVAIFRMDIRQSRERWILWYWARDENEAHALRRTTREQYRPQILKVRHAGTRLIG